jgi:glycine/D-amino acid oxidase-like deaminating enzyme/nitrite reductase/ring-hydroxylating ferredoxin subunit
VDTSPYWSDSASLPSFARLDRDTHVDVVIVGGGITGLTAAYQLVSAGKSVAVLERSRCAEVDTGHTSAHLTMVTDTRLTDLVSRLGRDHAQAVWDAGLAAIAEIDTMIREHQIDCDFAWVPGYLHAPQGEAGPDEADGFQAEASLVHDLGFDAEFVAEVPLVGGPGIRFDGQARFHPRRYLAQLAQVVVAKGGTIFERSAAEEFGEKPLCVKANRHTVTCNDIIIATHNPLVGVASMTSATVLQTKLALYTSYVIGARVARDTVPDALFWDTATPYQYVRLEPGKDHDVLIFGGEDHKTGQVPDTTDCFARLERALSGRVPEAAIRYRWSGQVIETPDGLPFIGRVTDHQYCATGFAGNGLTFGTLGAMMMSDAILGRSNPWSELFDPGRVAIARGAWDYIKENADYPYYKIRDWFAGVESRSLRSVKRSEGVVVERKGAKVAAYRNPNGALTVRSAVCPHMGCVVAWNTAERTWDCPCHGSRFTPQGDVISGPAESPLGDVEA